MRLEVELWQVITLTVTLVIALTGAFTALGRMLLRQHARHMDSSLDLIRQDSMKWRELELAFYKHLAEMPVQYIRRDDYVHGQTVIETKLDAIAKDLKKVELRGIDRD